MNQRKGKGTKGKEKLVEKSTDKNSENAGERESSKMMVEEGREKLIWKRTRNKG
jgi:hypothetical protein